jgi:HK97 family phage major capsid protein
MTNSQPKLGKFELRSKTSSAVLRDRSLLRDATLLQALAMKAFPSEFAFKLDDEIIRGTGAGQCLGIVGNAPTVSVAKETGRSRRRSSTENIIKMYARMLARCMSGAEWYINQTCWPQLFKMSVAVGTGGVPVYLPPNGAVRGAVRHADGPARQRDRAGIRVGTVGDIILANFSNDYALIRSR